jgi:hypothetical protein
MGGVAVITIDTLRAIARQPLTVRLGMVAIAPGRVKELLRHVPPTATADLSEDGTRLRIMWATPARRGRLVMLRLAPTWIGRHAAVVGPLSDALESRAFAVRVGSKSATSPPVLVTYAYGRTEGHARSALCERIGVPWKYLCRWTIGNVLEALRLRDVAEVMGLPDASEW